MVMMLQNRYQRRRMYTRIALGKNRAMDVVSGETSGGSGQLIILYPLLFGLQLGQCWIGARPVRVPRPVWLPAAPPVCAEQHASLFGCGGPERHGSMYWC
jgi:hypothetical protein